MRLKNSAAVQLIVQTIVRLRDERKLSQADLARLAGIERGVLAMFESGASGITIANLYAVAKALGVEARDLLPSMADVDSLRAVIIAGRQVFLTKSDIECLLQQLDDGEEAN